MRGTNEVGRIGIVLFYARGYGKYVGIEDDVVWLHAYLLCQQPIGTAGNGNTTVVGSSLPLFVEAHHYTGGTIATNIARMLQERGFTFLQ